MYIRSEVIGKGVQAARFAEGCRRSPFSRLKDGLRRAGWLELVLGATEKEESDCETRKGLQVEGET